MEAQSVIRILPSDPAYADIAAVANAIAQLVNAHVWWDLRGMPEAERAAALVELRAEFEELTH
jgi:hypothetical protein